MDRAFRVLLALTTTACAPAAWACSCLIYEPTRACEIRHSATTIFKGRVLDTNATVDGGFNTWALYRFRVDEIFKGLPAETKEVFIDPGSGTSCMTAFQLGQDYLVYTAKAITTSGDYFNRVRTTAQSPEMKVPAILPAWERATNSPVFWDMLCSPTRPIENEATDTDLAYLRSMSKTNAGDPPRLGTIFGTVAQNLDGLTTFKDAAPMKDVVVTLRPTSTSANAEPLTFSATSGPDGRFEIPNLAPGRYTVEWKPLFEGARPPPRLSREVSVPPNGCAALRGNFVTAASIAGRVVLPDGVTPAEKVVVEAGWLADTGDPKLRLISNARATTNQKGEFVIPDIPAHLPVVVGVNLNSAPNRTYRFDPVYAPDSTQSLESAKPFQLKPGAAVTGASIRMPDPLPFGDLYVEVLWPDGTPANGGAFASATADNGSRAGEAKAGDHETNRVRLELALNRDYSIRGIWLLFDPEYVRIEGESPAKIHFNRHGQTVRVTLKEKWPSPGR